MNFRTRQNSGPQAIRYDVYRLSVREWVLYLAEGIGICGVVVFTFYRSLPLFLISLPAGFLYPLYKRKDLKKKRLEQLNLQFKEGILILSAALSAGYSVENAFAGSTVQLRQLYGEEALLTREFTAIAGQLHMNRTVEQVLDEFADRSGLDDIKNFAGVFAASKRSGGELVSIISHTVSVIQDKIQVRQEILTLTAAKRMEQRIMNLIPFFLVAYIDSTSPGFFHLMYTTGLGRILMTVCLLVYLLAYGLSEKILNIEV